MQLARSSATLRKLAATVPKPMLFAAEPVLPDALSTVQVKLKGDLSKYADQQKKVTV